MIDDNVFCRPPVTIAITGPSDDYVHAIELPELVIAIPAERPAFDFTDETEVDA